MRRATHGVEDRSWREKSPPGAAIWECRKVERVLKMGPLTLPPERHSQRQHSDYSEERLVARPTVEEMADHVPIKRGWRRSFSSGQRWGESAPYQLKRDHSLERYPPHKDRREPERLRRVEKSRPPVRERLGFPGVRMGRHLEKGRTRPQPEPTATVTSMSTPLKVSGGSSRARKGRGSKCPVLDCQVVTRKLQDHAFFAHLPRYFGARFPQKNVTDMEVMEKVIQGLRQLATWILGPMSTPWDLLKFFNRNVHLSQDCVIHESSVAGMRHLCRDQGWNIPVKFSIHPLNSPACLRQWRVLLHLLNFLTEVQRREFRLFLVSLPNYSRRTDEEQAQQESDQELLVMDSPEAMWVPEDQVAINETVGSPEDWAAITETMWVADDQVEEPTQGQGGLDHLFDAHFYLDRSSPELMEAVPEVRHRLEHLPVWGVQVCCNPHTYPSKISIDPRYKTAVGLHPKDASYLNDQLFRNLLRFWRDDHCIVGELGLDHSAPAKEWKTQEAALRELLPYVPRGRPVILHVCGPEGYEEAGSTHTRAIQILSNILPQDQPVHVHCFTGMKDTVREWLKSFPQTYFGFTARARRFTQDQLEGLKAVPEDRVLLETESPCMPPVGYRTNSRTLLCQVADIVAEVRGIRSKELLWATNNNAARLFAK